MNNSIRQSALLEATGELARHTASIAMRYYRTNVDIEIKGDGSPVTVADKEAEQAARSWLKKRFPNDSVLGEEYGGDNQSTGRRWIIDPIDGTKSFVRGVPLWGTLIACCEGEEILAGAACFPAVDELIMAAPGEGCWWNGSRALVSRTSTLTQATVMTTDSRFLDRPDRVEQWRTLVSKASIARTWGDCFGYLLVATGRADVMVDNHANAWDAAALQPIIEEAGGVFTAWNGQRTAFGGDVIATNTALAQSVRTILRDVP